MGLLTEIAHNRFFQKVRKRNGPTTKQISLNIANHSQQLKVRKCVNLFLMEFLPFHAALPQKIWLRNLKGDASNACFSHFKPCCSLAGEDMGK